LKIVYRIHFRPPAVYLLLRGLDPPVRWDNRPGTDPGYTRIGDVLGATSPTMILAALDIPPTALGYHGA